MGKNKKKRKKRIISYSYLILHSLFSTGLVPQASKAELMVMTVSEIVKRLIEAHEEGKDVNLNK